MTGTVELAQIVEHKQEGKKDRRHYVVSCQQLTRVNTLNLQSFRKVFFSRTLVKIRPQLEAT